MFAAPLFLFGLLATAIPLLLHLRRSRRVRRIVFSTTRFFDERFIRASRRARIQDRLLMALRMALLALFALALAQPLLRLPQLAPLAGLTGAKRRVAIVLDDSASMGVVTGQGDLLERARAAALALLDELSTARGDRATLVLAGQRRASAATVFAQPTADLDAVAAAVRAVGPSSLATDLNAAITTAATALGDRGAGQREIYVFSDLQANGLAPGTIEGPGPDVNVILVAVRPPPARAAENVSVDSVQYGASRPMLGLPFTFRAHLTNHGHRPVERTVQLVVAERVVSERRVTLAPQRSQVVRFIHRFDRPGWFSGAVRLAAGAAGAIDTRRDDDVRHLSLFVAEGIVLLAVNGAPSQIPAHDELFFVRAALGAATARDAPEAARQQVEIRETDARALAPEQLTDAALVVLANVSRLEAAQVEALERYVDAGGSVLIGLGDRVDRETYNQWSGPHRLNDGLLPARLGPVVIDEAAGAGDDGRAGAADDPAAQADSAVTDAITDLDPDHPVTAPFADAHLGYLSAVRFGRRYRPAEGDASVLMRTASGDPVLIERRLGRGRVMLFASTFDRDWTDFPLQPTFVPWLYRVVSYLAQPGLSRAGFVRTGQAVVLPAGATDLGADPRILRPDGGTIHPRRATPDDADIPAGALCTTETDLAGVYTVRDAGDVPDRAPRLLFAANAPSRESEPAYLDEAALRSRFGPEASIAFIEAGASVGQSIRMARQGYGLWDQLLLLALIVALFEPWLANRIARLRGRQVTDALDRRSLATTG